MWRPESPVRHALPEARVPTRAEAEQSLLFRTLSHERLTLAERTWVPAMVPWRATDEGFVTDDVVEWYERFARGRPGALVVEATGIRDVASGPLLRIGHDRFLPGLERLVRAVRHASGEKTRLFIQIIDFLAIRRRPEPLKYFERYLSLTDAHRAAVGADDDLTVRKRLAALPRAELERALTSAELEALDHGYRERVTDMHLPHVRALPTVLPDLFASAAARAEQAGFDGVELHYAHAYTMASFLSRTNRRDDGYGSTLEGRLRLPLEVFAEVRARVSNRFLVGCRYLADECIPGGSDVDDACQIGVAFARAGMDFLSLSRGGKFDDAKQPKVGWATYPYTGRSGWECMPTTLGDAKGPFGRNVEAARRVKRALLDAGQSTPLVVSGAISSFDQAERILQSGAADIVAAARQSLADPDWFSKLRLGRGHEVRRCVFTNYCEGLDQKHKQVTCKLWDREHLDEPGVKLATGGHRRLIAPEWKP
jgi:2,4-dienoyl-CoA reductase-like NADH-dependent reductase (Old Yellow Enzyme family)